MITSKQYYLWLSADTLMLTTASIRSFVVPILILTMGGSATDAATLAAVGQIMNVIFVLPGGLIIDKFDRRLLMIISQVISIILFAAFVVGLMLFGYNLAIFYCLSIAMSIRNALLGNVTNVMLPSIVDTKELPEALGQNQARDSIVGMIASPVAAALLAISNIFPFLVGLVGNTVSLLATFGLKPNVPEVEELEGDVPETFGERIRKTIREATIGRHIVSSNKVIFTLTILTVLINPFLSSIFTMLTYYVTQTYGVLYASLIDTVASVAMIVGSFISIYLTSHFKTGLLARVALGILVLGAIATVIAPTFETKMLFFGLEGLMLPSINVVFSTLLMRFIPTAKLGRFESFAMFLTYFITIPSQFMVGLLYDALGFAVASYIYIAITALVSSISFIKELRSIPKATDLDAYIESLNVDI